MLALQEIGKVLTTMICMIQLHLQLFLIINYSNMRVLPSSPLRVTLSQLLTDKVFASTCSSYWFGRGVEETMWDRKEE